MKLNRLLALSLCVSTLFVGCSSGAPTTEETPSPTTDETTKQTLKIGVMPAVDTAPIYLAEEKGYFDELGLDLEIVRFNNAGERQTALQTNTIDGAMTDLIAVATNVDGGFDLKATTLTDGVFPVLVREGYKETPDIKVAMMEVSVSNFLIDEWLSDEYNIEKVFINDIPARLEMIKSGGVDMGLFPEPMASNATVDGTLEKRIYTPEDGICPNVMAFTSKALEEKEEAIQLFHEGYNKGVEDLIQNPDAARDTLITNLELNPAIRDTMILPTYTKAHLPGTEYMQKIISWVQENLKQDITVTPDLLVDGKFVE